MRRLILVCVFALASLTALAQDQGAYLAIMPGYIAATSEGTLEATSWYRFARQSKDGFMASLEGGFSLSRHCGLHFAYLGARQGFDEKIYANGSVWPMGNGHAPLNILEVGPEIFWRPSKASQVFIQINLGHTFSSGTATYDLGNAGTWTTRMRDDDWVMGFAAGYRGYLSKAVGLCIQTTYHQVSSWKPSSLWAVQAGVVFRF